MWFPSWLVKKKKKTKLGIYSLPCNLLIAVGYRGWLEMVTLYGCFDVLVILTKSLISLCILHLRWTKDSADDLLTKWVQNFPCWICLVLITLITWCNRIINNSNRLLKLHRVFISIARIVYYSFSSFTLIWIDLQIIYLYTSLAETEISGIKPSAKCSFHLPY